MSSLLQIINLPNANMFLSAVSRPDVKQRQVLQHNLFVWLMFLNISLRVRSYLMCGFVVFLQKQDLALLQCVTVNQTILLQILQEENSATKVIQRLLKLFL